MDRLAEIETNIKGLSRGERIRLERWFFTHMVPLDQIAEEEEAANRIEELAFKYEPVPDRYLMSVDEYMALELKSPERHEFVAGLMFAMTGVSRARGVRRLVYYPDVMVACDRGKPDEYHTSQPKLIVEVLSPSTRNTDQREKFVNYRHLASVQEYVMIEQQRPELTIYRRGVSWQKDFICGLEAIAEFKSIELTMPLAQIFEGVVAY